MIHAIEYASSTLIVVAGISLVLVRLLLNAFTPGVYHYPGPWLAKFTDFWRLYEMKKKRQQVTFQALHKAYGPVVRIGPNLIHVSDPVLIEPIFGNKTDFPKSDIQKVWRAVKDGKVLDGIADTQSKIVHGQLKRPVANLYSMTNIHRSEPFVESTLRHFLKRLDTLFIQPKRLCRIENWLQYFAFDVMGELTFSRRLGYLDQGGDIDGTLVALDQELTYRAVIGQMPWLDRVWKKNPLYLKFARPTNPLAIRTMKLVKEREQDQIDPKRRDMFTGFVEAKETHPDTVDHTMVIRYTMTNIISGSDTTSLAMGSILYNTIKNPRVLNLLRKELDSANLTYPPDFRKAVLLPYLHAVIREGLRIHPVTGFSSERIVPETGLALPDGRYLPPGINVAMSAWIVHFDKSVYGEDADKFRPERWLREEGEDNEVFENRLRLMKRSDLTFSTGPRACLGKHIAQLEIYKTIPTLLGCLDIELAYPERELKSNSTFFAKAIGIDVNIRWRDGVDKNTLMGLA